MQLTLSVLREKLAICRLDPKSPVPAWAGKPAKLVSISRTPDELSIVCPQKNVPDGIKSAKGWQALKVAGPLDFALFGILASLTTLLANAKISIFALSTYDTDYILVKSDKLAKAIKILDGPCKIVKERRQEKP